MNVSNLAIGMLNATWQSVALIGATAIGLRLCRKVSAPVRCALWSSVFFLSALLPVADLAMQHTLVVAPPVQHPGTYAIVSSGYAQPARDALDTPFKPQRALKSAPEITVRVFNAPASAAAPNPVVAPARAWQGAGGAVLALYALGAAFFLIRLAIESFALLRLKRRASPLDRDALGIGTLPRGAWLAGSSDVSIPCVLGLGRPAIVVPDDMLRELSPADLRRVVSHEAAHLERYDDWTNLFEQVVLAAFFYNPAMHFAARQIATEREIACDDRVVMREGETLNYAECLASLVHRAAEPRRIPVPGLYAGPRQIVVRIERLLDRAYVRTRRFGSGFVVTSAAVLALAIAVVGFDVPVIADPIPAPPAISIVPQSGDAPALPVRLDAPAPLASQKTAKAPAHAAPVAPKEHVVRQTYVVASYEVRRSAVVAAASAPPAPPVLAPATAQAPDPSESAGPFPTMPPMPAISPMPNVGPMHFPRLAPMPSMPPAPRLPRSWTYVIQNDNGRYVYRSYSSGSVYEMRSSHDGSMLDALKASGYGKLSVDDLVRLADSGCSPASIVAFSRLFGHPSVDQLVRLGNAAVSPAYVEHLRAAGLTNLSIDDAVRLANAGVMSADVARYFRALSTTPSIDDIIKLHNDGVH